MYSGFLNIPLRSKSSNLSPVCPFDCSFIESVDIQDMSIKYLFIFFGLNFHYFNSALKNRISQFNVF